MCDVDKFGNLKYGSFSATFTVIGRLKTGNYRHTEGEPRTKVDIGRVRRAELATDRRIVLPTFTAYAAPHHSYERYDSCGMAG
jgi:hypothetical protein